MIDTALPATITSETITVGGNVYALDSITGVTVRAKPWWYVIGFTSAGFAHGSALINTIWMVTRPYPPNLAILIAQIVVGLVALVVIVEMVRRMPTMQYPLDVVINTPRGERVILTTFKGSFAYRLEDAIWQAKATRALR
jgi:hypothetical protein